MDGTVALLKTSPVRIGDEVDESTEYFHRLFWTFPPCVEAFKHCKPLISIDGMHLYGKYGGTLFLAIAQDENSNILPVAFALVEGKNAESWAFFLSHLRQHVTPQEGILVISDRHNVNKAALEAPDSGWLPPHAYREYCIRHVAANFALSFKGQDARRLLVNVAYAKIEAEFDCWFDIMSTENPAMCDWANRVEYDKWTQHQDRGRWFGHMTTNISECVNSLLKGTRSLPVTTLVKSTYGRHQSEYTVAEMTPTGNFSLGTYRVSLRDRTCDCGYFQALHYLCCHAIACCAQSRLDWATYVHEVYTMSKVFSVYWIGFPSKIALVTASTFKLSITRADMRLHAVLSLEGLWPPYDGPTVIPDLYMRHAREE
ncbi:uncharacterized protein LOC107614939 [Arachis ipaensis]|uniref:uncharacterized protein LOC107614939 n=1 Tax=Arachis ipaensis TaxID=130454 RepID=UPI0007AFB807|nr:uncharacterized protein LOC107614939 [Arachis ipaensis]